MSVANQNNSPQWKNYQPPPQDSAILSYQTVPTPNMVSAVISTPSPTVIPANINVNTRETGIVEKLMHSYGFIQCCDREARLFFHFSEYAGNISTMKIGDAVEFQLSYDRHTGRPIASAVVKVDPEFVSSEILSKEKFIGSVVQEARMKEKNGTIQNGVDGIGRVTYEHNGECFFLPYSINDVVDPNVKLAASDQVSFYLATDKRNGNLSARKLELIKAVGSSKIQGVVNALGGKYGFIERADVVKEIFFHYSEFKGNVNELHLGKDVEFTIQNRNGKDVAVSVCRLPQGSVIFEDISLDTVTGEILKTLKNHSSKRPGETMSGRINFKSKNGPIELPFGDKDQIGDFTLLVGDIVELNMATDRRDKLKRATNIILNEDSFNNQGEKRERGKVNNLKEGFGFIQCAERDARMFFNFGEVLDPTHELKIQDEVEFTVTQDPASPTKQVAIRIKVLPRGSVTFQSLLPGSFIGTIDREPSSQKTGKEHGKIVFDYEGEIQLVSYVNKDIADGSNIPKTGDKVEFNILEMKRNSSKLAVNVKLVLRNIQPKPQGFIAALKDNFGFIECADHKKEIFFHFSAFDGDPKELDLGDEVDYTLTKRHSKSNADNVKKLPKGTILTEEILHNYGMLEGKVVRPMRIINPDQDEYEGLVQVDAQDGEKTEYYLYGITSLVDKREFLQKGDAVTFQVGLCFNGSHRALNMAAIRKFVRSTVDSVKGQYGFLNYEVEGKKLFFHMTEVQDVVTIQAGDEVEFVVVQNQRNGKYSACNMRKLTNKKRPERLLSRLKSLSVQDDGPKLIVIRQPKGPDGTKGFKLSRE